MRHVATAIVGLVLLLGSAAATAQQSQVYGKDYIIVTPGMTLTRIMREFYPTRRGEWAALMDEIIVTNPHAFVNGAPASLKRGMRINLPGTKRATTTASTTTRTTTTAAAATTAANANVSRLTVTGSGAAPTTATASGNVARTNTTKRQVATSTTPAAPATATTSGNVSRSTPTQANVATGANTRYVVQPDPTRKRTATTSVAVASTAGVAAATSAGTSSAASATASGTSASVGAFTPSATPGNNRATASSKRQETVAASNLPAPVSSGDRDDSGLDASTAPASADKEKPRERPPWWWIGSALLVLALIL